MNETLLAKAVEAKVVRTGKVRADTTVVSANVEYPTDSGLLARAVTKISKLVRRIKAAGGATRTRFRDRSRAATARVRAIGAKLKLRRAAGRDDAQATVLRLTGELAGLAEHAGRDAYAVLDNARRAMSRVVGRANGRLRRAIDELSITVDRARRVVAQTRRRLAGDKPDSATRLVSLHDPDARPIAKGRLNRPIEFGYKAQVVDNEDGIVLDYDVRAGNPAGSGIFAWAALALAPFAVAAFAPPAVASARTVAAHIAVDRLAGGLRAVARTSALRRALGGSDRALRWIHLTVPAAGLAAWWAATMPAGGRHAPVVMAVLALGVLLAVYRTATRQPMSYDAGLAATPFGPIPINLLRRVVRGPDLVAALVLLGLFAPPAA